MLTFIIMIKNLKNRVLPRAVVHIQNLTTLLKKIYSLSLLTQLVNMCTFFSACKCSYIKYDFDKQKFQTSKLTQFWTFCLATTLCILLTLVQAWELLVTKKSIFQYILFFISICSTVAGSACGAFSICKRKLLILLLNWISAFWNAMKTSMCKQFYFGFGTYHSVRTIM